MNKKMSAEKFKTAEQLRNAIMGLEFLDYKIPAEWVERLAILEKQEAEQSARLHSENECRDDSFVSIYDTLVKESKFKPTPEKKKCIFETVEKLLVKDDDAEKPGLLLGNIQCGKTDTFVKIMAHAFDEGIDVTVVLTKGTNALAEQTRLRMEEEFKFFERENGLSGRPIVSVYDIMDIKNGGLIKQEVNRHKNIIICKKEDDNLGHLINLFDKVQPLLKSKKILIVDDEADFASWNYMRKHGEVSLAPLTKLIKQFIEIPTFCRYLQVTATPYSLYLQPDQSILLDEDGCIRPMKPRFTTIVPTHEQYVGGEHYFIKSLDKDSMYSYLFHPISEKCLEVMKTQNKRYITNMLTSDNIKEFRYAIFSYLIAAVIRRIQKIDSLRKEHPKNQYESDDERFDDIYKSSCLIHIQVKTNTHIWQETLIMDLIQKIKDAYCGSGDKSYFENLFNEIYDDFVSSNKAAREVDKVINASMPSKEEVINELKNALNSIEPREIVHVVNSTRSVGELLDRKSGQLKLKSLFNIFIGGSILDRGITINNMLGFFYGRTTNTYQQDTVLQHMRQYGSRSKEDMAVTRMHTTYELHKIITHMTQMDNQLRDWLINEAYQDPDMKAVFIGLAPDSKVRPCAKGKIVVSDTVTITPGSRLTTSGFQTGPKSSIHDIVQSIDNKLSSLSNYKENVFFKVNKHLIYDIIRNIRKTFVYDDQPGKRWNNYGFDWNCDDMIGLLDYCTGSNTEDVECMVRTNMNMGRLRSNGRFIDAPETGRSDGEKARRVAQEKPAIILFRENGLETQGWRGTPFYWPVAYASQRVNPAIFAAGADVPEFQVADIDLSKLMEGLNPENVLRVQCQKPIFDAIETGESDDFIRSISESFAGKLLLRDLTGNGYEIDTKAIKDESLLDAGIHTYNNGKFPFIVKEYTHILLWCKDGRSYKYMLTQIDKQNPYKILPAEEDTSDKDLLVYPSGHEIKETYNNFVIWTIKYKVRKIKSETFQSKLKRRAS